MSTTVQNPGEAQDEVKQPNAGEIRKGMENHRLSAEHHKEAAKHHLNAAKYHEDGNHEEAQVSAVLAYGHSCVANDCQKEDAKHHALTQKNKAE